MVQPLRALVALPKSGDAHPHVTSVQGSPMPDFHQQLYLHAHNPTYKLKIKIIY